MIVFHGTEHYFERFDLSRLGRSGGERATNGALGVHVGTSTMIPRMFDGSVLVLEIEDPIVEIHPLSELKRIHNLGSHDDDQGFKRYEQYRQEKLSAGINVIGFREMDGQIDHAIILDLDKISIIERVPNSDTARLDELDDEFGSVPLELRSTPSMGMRS